MSELLFFIIGTMLGGVVGVVCYVPCADKQAVEPRGGTECENEMCRYFSV